MASRGTTSEEKAIILEMQKNIAEAKKNLRQYERGAQKLFMMLTGSREAGIAAEAYKVKAAAALAVGYAETAHSAGTDALVNCFEDGGIVVFGGGGGR